MTDHLHDRGLAFDLTTLRDRRNILKLLGGAGLVALVGCGKSNNATTTTALAATTTTAPTTTTKGTPTSIATSSTAAPAVAVPADCSVIPEETGGPFPGDGSNGPNALSESGVVRSDIRSSFGSSATVAKGVPLTIKLRILDQAKTCAPMAGAAVYVWHCDMEGRYSLYSSGATNENYLRGVQETDKEGLVTFTSIFPAAYSGRWPHIHFEVFPSVAAATGVGRKLATSQVALPQDVCEAVYATDGYSQSVRNLSQVSLQSDNVFGDDGGKHQLATISGSAPTGIVAALAVPV